MGLLQTVPAQPPTHTHCAHPPPTVCVRTPQHSQCHSDRRCCATLCVCAATRWGWHIMAPIVDGPGSIDVYYECLDGCQRGLMVRAEHRTRIAPHIPPTHTHTPRLLTTLASPPQPLPYHHTTGEARRVQRDRGLRVHGLPLRLGPQIRQACLPRGSHTQCPHRPSVCALHTQCH